jgi:hypothetical protein
MAKSNGVQVTFTSRDNGPERLVCEAEIVFDEGPLAGAKLVGFSLWKGADGEVYVTFPSRAFGVGGERRFFDYLRAVDGSGETIKGIKAWIIHEYRNSAVAAA